MSKIERQLVGEPIALGARTVQPVARVVGQRGSGGRETGGGAGAWLRIQPVEVIVRENDGREYRVSVTGGTQTTTRGMILAALMIAGVCWLLMRALAENTGQDEEGKR